MATQKRREAQFIVSTSHERPGSRQLGTAARAHAARVAYYKNNPSSATKNSAIRWKNVRPPSHQISRARKVSPDQSSSESDESQLDTSSTQMLLVPVPHSVSPVFGGIATDTFPTETRAVAAENAEYCRYMDRSALRALSLT